MRNPIKDVPQDKRPLLVGGAVTLLLLITAFLLSPVVKNNNTNKISKKCLNLSGQA